MTKRMVAIATAALFLASVSASSLMAQTAAPASAPATTPAKKPAAKKKEPKKLSAQQQKMKDCAAKWKDHKASTGAKGRKAYNEFMKPCLKGTGA